jgi:hypothetical protein
MHLRAALRGIMKDCYVYYDTAYQRDCRKRAWREKPEGLLRVHLGHRFYKTESGTLVVPVIAICQRNGRMIKETHKVHITAATAKPHSPRLRRVAIPE